MTTLVILLLGYGLVGLVALAIGRRARRRIFTACGVRSGTHESRLMSLAWAATWPVALWRSIAAGGAWGEDAFLYAGEEVPGPARGEEGNRGGEKRIATSATNGAMTGMVHAAEAQEVP